MKDTLNQSLLDDTRAELRHWRAELVVASAIKDAPRVEECKRFY